MSLLLEKRHGMERYEKAQQFYLIPCFLEKYVFLSKIDTNNFDLEQKFTSIPTFLCLCSGT
jgi:hypothetical protein